MYKQLLHLILAMLVLVGCSEQQHQDETKVPPPPEPTMSIEVTPSCEDREGMQVHCGFKNPEDIVIVPGGEMLIISEMGEFMKDSPGQLVSFEISTSASYPLSISFDPVQENWGDASCQRPVVELFSPHGIDLITRSDGRHQLLVVNHGGREAVEMFELLQQDSGWTAHWRGCALPPGDPFINDVAGLQNGGFLVTHMWNKSTPFETVAEQLLGGEKVGWVWQWQPDKGFSKLPDSDEQMPNGIAVSRDNRFAFVNIYMGNKTIKIDLVDNKKVGEFAVRQPDNITLDDDGYLWVASHQHDPLKENCDEIEEGPCLLPFNIIKANGDTLDTEVFLSQDGEPMGYATVATHLGGRLYMGSAHGDRIVSVPTR